MKTSPKKIFEFAEALLATPVNNTSSDVIKTITEEWCKFYQATWAWVWGFNDITETPRWELLAAHPDDNKHYFPNTPYIEKTNSITALAWKSQKPVRIRSLEEEVIDKDFNVFSVVNIAEIQRLGGNQFIAIPLLNGPQKDPTSPSLKLTICLHFSEKTRTPEISDENLKFLGRITALKIHQSIEEKTKLTLLSLNRLAEAHLAGGFTQPELQREKYCYDLIRVIKESVGTKYVSLFYRDYQYNNNAVSCLASTGLIDENAKVIPKSEYYRIRYHLGQRTTGTVYESAIPVITMVGEDTHSGAPPLSTELPLGTAPKEVSWIIYPIKSDPPVGEGEMLGVIRCVVSSYSICNGAERNFTKFQIQLLEFIMQQVSSVLKTFEKEILRETLISMVRHDIADPIKALGENLFILGRFLLQHNLIAPESSGRTKTILKETLSTSQDNFNLWMTEGREDKLKYEFSDVLVNFRLLNELTTQLHNEHLINYNPTKTNIGSDIIAPLKSIYNYLAKERNEMRISFGEFSQFPWLMVDREQIQRVLVNLIVNAIKYGHPGTVISVQPIWVGYGFGFSVINEGDPIPQEDAERLFDGRFRSESAFQKAPGVGLGLKISRAIMERHKGTLTFRQNIEKSLIEFRASFPPSARTY